jgi:hypothetical protein
MPFRRKRLLVALLVSVVALAGVPLYLAGTAEQATADHTGNTAQTGNTAHPVKPADKTGFPTRSARPANSARDYWVTPGLNRLATMALEGFEEALKSDETYGGVEIQRPGVRFRYVGRPSAAFTAKLATLPASLDWELREAPNSYASLMHLTAELDKDYPMWVSKGVTMSSWGPNITTNHVSVTLAFSSVSYPLQASKLIRAYGKGMLQVSLKPGAAVPVAGVAAAG